GCGGLGHVMAFDPQRVVGFPSLRLASGAVKGWDRRNPYTYSMIECLGKHYGVDMEQPFEELPAHVQQVILYGSGEDEIEFVYEADGASGRKRKVKRSHPFEGILNNFERRFKETDSAAVREELARYQQPRACPDCHGTRLRREARRVKLLDATTQDTRAIFEIGHATLAEAHQYFEKLTLQGAKAEIAAKVVSEIRSRLRFLNDVGLNYLSLDRSADTLS